MKIVNGLIFRAVRLSQKAADISKEAQRRLKWFDYYYSHSQNARLTYRHFDISPQTFYRWKHRYDPNHLESLEDRSHRPKHVRQPTAPPELVEAVLKLREEYPRWEKDKIAVLLREQGLHVSTSMVGRTIRRLKDRGVLKEPVKNHVSARRRILKHPYAIRKPEDYEVTQPGDLVQLDTLDIRP
ncbi:MAG TPA: helix-turn-helix domain-containing protein, partial [Dehalococcoidia bacterium]|nr:helix-turn-helix domain-containing protein [Dehalococcoidia bacterium]